jgi:phosphate transport system substrate-binding protein
MQCRSSNWPVSARACLSLVLLLCGCSKHEEEAPPPKAAPVRVDGSSTVYLISKIVSEEAAKQGIVTATVNESGTTGGFKKFCAGEIDISGASRPIQQAEIDACKAAGINFIELPIGYDGLAIVVNAKNTWADHLTIEELKRMWEPGAKGTVTSWKQIRDAFPNRPLHLLGPDDQSGTFDYFTQAVVGTQHASRTDYTSNADDTALVRGVADDENALGYFGFAYLRDQPKLRAVPIDDGDVSNGSGAVAPSAVTVANGTYQPLSRPIFIYVSVKASSRPEVDRFVTFYLQAARELSAEVGYISLPLHTTQLAVDRYKARRVGTMFAGNAPSIGVTMEKLLEVEQR